MDGFKLGRLYKGEEYTMTLPVPFSGEVDDFQFLLFTDSATTVEIPKAQITIEDGVMEFTVQETDLDVLNDGVLNYYLKYTVGSTDKIQCTNTMHYLKSPSDYNPKTTQDIYNEGYEAGVEAGSGDYSDGFVDGEQAQKNKLTGITINQNGTYQREDGYNDVVVSVPQTQYNSQSKNYNLTSNGTTTITPDAGYDGITGGTITVDVPQTGHTDAEITAAYNSGYTAGEAEGEVAGAAAQKALLVSTAITENGVYTRENGYNSVNVSIAQTGHTDAELEQAYNNGYTTGAAAQKSLLVTTAITQNGVYTRENGYSEVSVNVPSSVSNVMAKFPGSFGSWYDTSSFLHNNGQVLSIKFTLPDNQYSRHIYDSSDEDGEGGIYIAYNSHNNVSQITCDFDDEDLLIFSLTGYTFPLQCVLTLTYKKGDYLIGKLTTDNDEQVVTTRGVPAFTLDSSLGFCFNNYRDDYAFSQSDLVIDYLRLYDIDSNNNKTITHNFEFDGTNFVDYLSNNVSTTNYEIVNSGGERARVRTDTVPSSVTRTYINDSMALYQSKDFQITQTTQITVDAPYDGITGGTITVNGQQGTGNMLHFVAEEANSTICLDSVYRTELILYKSTNGVNFTDWDGTVVTLSNVGDTLWVYGANQTLGTVENGGRIFIMTGKIAAYGDVTYLLQSGGLKTMTGSYNFKKLFMDCTSLTRAPELPATGLTEYCYLAMFQGCTNLVLPPVLPATHLEGMCYQKMFSGCTSLVNAPALPATELDIQCYNYMFVGCTSLETAPELPATVLRNNCYDGMFDGCTGLTTVPLMAGDTTANNCCDWMFRNCSSLNSIKVTSTNWNSDYCGAWVSNVSPTGTFYKPANTVIPTGHYGIPNGWTVVNI